MTGLHSVYAQIAEVLGMETAIEIHRMFHGQQVTFPVRLYSAKHMKLSLCLGEHGGHMYFIAVKLRKDFAAHIAYEPAENIEPQAAARLLLCVSVTPEALKK